MNFDIELSNGKQHNQAAYGTCVWIYQDKAVSYDLRKLLRKKGYSLILDDILAMPLTFITDFPDKLARKLIAESENKIKDISLAIVNGEKTESKVELKSHLVSFTGKVGQLASRLFGLELHAGESVILAIFVGKIVLKKTLNVMVIAGQYLVSAV